MKNALIRMAKNSFFGKKYQGIVRRLHVQETLVRQTASMLAGIDFQGQIDQDMIAYLYFGGKKEGFYIDIGANDGKTFSNTYIFEKLGWKGICIEPIPDVFQKLKTNRSCDCFEVAISNTNNESAEFIKVKDFDMYSGLNNLMEDAHKKRIKSENFETEKICVKSLTFDDLMSNYPDRKYVDFLSIDVEGAEMDILQSLNFTKYSFGLITVEHNSEVEGNDKKLKLVSFMEKQGYKIYLDLSFDIMFIPIK